MGFSAGLFPIRASIFKITWVDLPKIHSVRGWLVLSPMDAIDGTLLIYPKNHCCYSCQWFWCCPVARRLIGFFELALLKVKSTLLFLFRNPIIPDCAAPNRFSFTGIRGANMRYWHRDRSAKLSSGPSLLRSWSLRIDCRLLPIYIINVAISVI